MQYYKRKLIYFVENKLSITKNIIYIFCFTSLLSIIGCDSFVDVEFPKTQLTAGAVFEDRSTANAAMVDVYSKMRDAGLFTGAIAGMPVYLGHYADEFSFYGNSNSATSPFNNNILLSTNSDVRLLWNNSYNQIYSANAIIEGLEKSTNLATVDRNELKGEAIFVRAFIHFQLANLYGSIPYLKTTDYLQNMKASKIPAALVYTTCIADLKDALKLLPENYKLTDRTRPNKSAAQALLSRVYLYNQQWAESATEATGIINKTSLYPYESNLDKIFLKESTSTIWQFGPRAVGGNTIEAATFIFTAGPPSITGLNKNLVDAFTADDKRKTSWIQSVSNTSSTWYYAAKYKNRGTGTSTEYSIVLRLSELYLIRAEGRIRSGDLTGGKDDLNFIRNKAGLANTLASSSAELLDAILKERRLELFAEFGHRFFDLKRFNQLDVALAGKANWATFKSNFPIPETEINLNPNLLPQNAGY